MNQFTRSLLYSTAVVALGLGAVIAIYSESQTNFAALEPAAGVEAPAIAGDAGVLEQTTFKSNLPAEADIDALVEQADANAQDILAEIEAIMSAVEAEASETIQAIEPAAGDAAQAAQEAIEGVITEAAPTEAAADDAAATLEDAAQ